MTVLQFPAVEPSNVDPPVDEEARREEESRKRAEAMLDLEHLNIDLQQTVATLAMRLQQERASRLKAIQAYPYLWTGAGVIVAAAVAWFLRTHDIEGGAIVFVFPVIAASVVFGRWPAVFGVVFQAVLYNLVWIAPDTRFTVPSDSEIIRFALYMVIPFMIHALKRLDWPPDDLHRDDH